MSSDKVDESTADYITKEPLINSEWRWLSAELFRFKAWNARNSWLLRSFI